MLKFLQERLCFLKQVEVFSKQVEVFLNKSKFFGSRLKIFLSKSEGGALIFDTGSTNQTYSLYLLTPEPLFNPATVFKVEFQFRVTRNTIPNSLPDIYFSFYDGQISLS